MMDSITGYKTVWAYNVPEALRPSLLAGFPAHDLRFVSIHRAVRQDLWRIMRSPTPTLAMWGDGCPSDLWAVAAESGLPVFQLFSGPLTVPAEGGQTQVPLSYGFTRITAPPTGFARALPLAAEAALQAGQALPAPALARLVETYVQQGLAAHTYPATRLASVPAAGGKPGRVVVIAESRSPYHTPTHASEATTALLLQQARRENPEAYIVLMLDGDRAISSRLRTQIGQNAVALADEVVAGYYHPSVLLPGDKVYVLSSLAGLDAMLRGLEVICLGEPLYKKGLAPQAPAGLLQQIFAAYFLDGLTYIDPALAKPVDLAAALHIAHEATPPERRVASVQPALAGQKAAPAAAEAPRGKPAPAAVEAKARPAAPVAAAAPKARSASRPDEATKPAGKANRFIQPDWMQSENLFTVLQTGPGLRQVVALTADLAAHPVALAMLETAGIDARLLRLKPDVPRAVMDDYAGQVVDVYQDAVRLRLREFDPARSVLLVGDIDSMAMRLAARVARDAGLPRLHVPATPYEADAAAGAGHARSLLSLTDEVLGWDDSHAAFLRAVGGTPEQMFRWQPPAMPATGSAAETATGAAPVVLALRLAKDAAQPRLDRAVLSGMAELLARYAATFDLGVEWIASPGAAGSMGPLLVDEVLAQPRFRFSTATHLASVARAAMRPDAVVISDDADVLSVATAFGRRSIRLVSQPQPQATQGMAWDAASLGAALRQSLDDNALSGTAAATATSPVTSSAISLAEVLAEQRVRHRTPSAGERLFRQEALPIALLGSSTPLDVFVQTQKYVLDMMGFSDLAQTRGKLEKISQAADVDLFAVWGIRASRPKTETTILARALKRDLLILEDGFLRSIQIGLSGEPALAVLLDDLTAYYDATHPSRLELTLDGPAQLNPQQLERARKVAATIRETKVTKYNFAPYKAMAVGQPGRPKILLVDQRYGDQSVSSGLAGPHSFAHMLDVAMSFAATHDIIIKTHPDRNIGGKEGYFTDQSTAKYAGSPHMFFVEEDMNPYSLIDICEKVFVVTSGMGFEALIAGKEVWCFGVPFYSNWGATVDMQRLDRRSGQRTMEEILHFSYIAASRYYSPSQGSACEIESVIDYIVQERPFRIAAEDVAANRRHAGPAREARRPNPAAAAPVGTALPNGEAKPGIPTLAVNFSKWKRAFLTSYFPERSFTFLENNQPIENSSLLDAPVKPEVMVWGSKVIPGLPALAARRGLTVCRVEDGFIRSVGLGAEKRLPYSLCTDYAGIYFDARSPSDLETIIATYDFRRDVRLMDTARSALAAFRTSKLSKYNFPPDIDPEKVYGPKQRKRVLVIGQVEDDASILYGAPPGSTNNNLVRLARAENPDAQVIYKIHPDVLARLRPELSDPNDVQDICQIVSTRMPFVDALHEVDHVYTLTSLAGFEALLRDIKVTTVGAPFYSGWGLTDSRMPLARRQRKLRLEELFAAAYILYPAYFDPTTGQRITLEETIFRLQEELRGVENKTAA